MNVVKVLVAAVLACMLINCSSTPVDDGKVPISTSSDKARELFVQARNLNEGLRANDAIPLLEQALALDSNFAQAHLLMSQVAPGAAEFFASLDAARKSAAHASEAEQLMITSFDAGVNGNTPVQEQTLQKLVAARPRDERVHTLVGNLYFAQQRYPEAIAAYQKALAIDSTFSPVYNQLGYSYRFSDKDADAEIAFKKYIELVPNDPNPYDSYAELLMKLGRFDESIAQYERALKVQSTFQPSYFGIATNLNFLGRHEEARVRLQQVLDAAENDGQRRAAFNAMAASYIDEGKYEQALEMLTKQYDIAATKNDFAAMSGDVNTIGNVLLEMGRYDDALKKFNETVEMQAKAENNSEKLSEQARLNFEYDAGRVAAWKGDLETAKKYLASYQAKAEANQNPFQLWQAHQLAGIVAMQEKNWDEAISRLKQSNLQNPYNLYLIGEAYNAVGDTERAPEYLHKAANFNLVNNIQQSMARRRVARMTGEA